MLPGKIFPKKPGLLDWCAERPVYGNDRPGEPRPGVGQRRRLAMAMPVSQRARFNRLLADDLNQVIAYIEGVKDGRRFLEVVRKP